ncbi:MAG TPA: FliM/FliN family flagellar motor C-terminal domain-containing protein [Sphingomicrobium sp.]|nr:FliM/FliN family flagellar motor C-terminal domain-containing protein [Sphingomicrobium sp.]
MKPWLPSDAIQPAALAPVLSRILRDWSKHWFVTDEASAGAAFQDDWPAAQASTNWRSAGSCASIALNPTVQAAVGSAMLGCAIPHSPVQPRDREIIDCLATVCIDDLLKRVAQLSGEGDADVGPRSEPIDLDACNWWDVSFRSGKRAFKLALSSIAQIRIVKRELPAAPKPELKAVARGLGKQQIGLTADVGRSAIKLAELKDLGVGDIVLLDRLSTEPVDLLIDGFASPLGGMLESIDGQTCILLDSFKDQRNA